MLLRISFGITLRCSFYWNNAIRTSVCNTPICPTIAMPVGVSGLQYCVQKQSNVSWTSVTLYRRVSYSYNVMDG